MPFLAPIAAALFGGGAAAGAGAAAAAGTAAGTAAAGGGLSALGSGLAASSLGSAAVPTAAGVGAGLGAAGSALAGTTLAGAPAAFTAGNVLEQLSSFLPEEKEEVEVLGSAPGFGGSRLPRGQIGPVGGGGYQHPGANVLQSLYGRG